MKISGIYRWGLGFGVKRGKKSLEEEEGAKMAKSRSNKQVSATEVLSRVATALVVTRRDTRRVGRGKICRQGDA